MPKTPPNIDSDIGQLHSIANRLSPALKKIGINILGDLLWYFPWCYDDLSQIKKINALIEGEISTIQVAIKSIKTYRSWRRKMIITEMLASDDTDNIQVRWFRQKFVGQILKVGDAIYLSGKPQKDHNVWQMISPTYEKVKDKPIHSARLVPMYHLSGPITQKQLRFLINKTLEDIKTMPDPLPVDILNQEKYPWLHEALQEIHFPTDEQKFAAATARLKFQELFYLQCKYQLAKQDYQSHASYNMIFKKDAITTATKNLPFKLTIDQNQALSDILADISQKKPMNRLLEGDVGSGKTVVAVLAALTVIDNGYQVAFMAPTEILAQQHLASLKKILSQKYWPAIALLTRTSCQLADGSKLKKSEIVDLIKNNQIKFIIGTHALIQEKINFKKLALAIIDEQHRFGVKQRQALKQKNKDQCVPHLLSMTATPIPRTLSLTLYGDLDISLIKTKPLGRQPVKTFLVPEKKRADAYKFIREKIDDGQQAFVICPLIDESDCLGVKSVTQEYQNLNDKIFPDIEIRMVHGQLKPEVKEKIMTDFRAKKFPILIATSVIEVGVDIPGATLMIIEGTERFGLSQLHQFRGRIGRNNQESFCLLFTTDDSSLSTKRLQALSKTNDGFKLAELDLELRGAGEIFGTKQTGLVRLKIAQLSDVGLIKKAQTWAKQIIGQEKYLSYTDLQKLLQTLKTEMHLE